MENMNVLEDMSEWLKQFIKSHSQFFFLKQANKYVSQAEFEVWTVQNLQGRFFSYTLELLLWAVVTQLRDESWYSSWEELRQNSVSTWKIH